MGGFGCKSAGTGLANAIGRTSLTLGKKERVQRATEMRADLVQVIIRDGTFTKVEDGLVFHVARREPASSGSDAT